MTRRVKLAAITISAAALGLAVMGAAQQRGDHCATSVTQSGASGATTCFQTTDELVDYMRSNGVDVPDGLFDRNFPGEVDSGR